MPKIAWPAASRGSPASNLPFDFGASGTRVCAAPELRSLIALHSTLIDRAMNSTTSSFQRQFYPVDNSPFLGWIWGHGQPGHASALPFHLLMTASAPASEAPVQSLRARCRGFYTSPERPPPVGPHKGPTASRGWYELCWAARRRLPGFAGPLEVGAGCGLRLAMKSHTAAKYSG